MEYLKPDSTHEKARAVVEFALKLRGSDVVTANFFTYPESFVKKHKLDKRFKGHSFDIVTTKAIIEIDDYKKHSKKNQKINDGIIDDFVLYHTPGFVFFRLQKEEIVDSKGYLQPTAAQYLRENLF